MNAWMKTTLLAGLAGAVAIAAACEPANDAPVAEAAPGDAPRFQVNPVWPQELPEDWILGQVAGVAVDDRDHVWIVHRPTTVDAVNAGAAEDPPIARCCTPAPPVIEYDREGAMVQAWGEDGEDYRWPAEAHAIFVDHDDNVWIAGGHAASQLSGHYVLKFDREGEFLLQIGERDETGGSNDTELLGGPTGLHVDPEDNEVYIADGYQNRRVIVFDAETGEYRRHWGAYGNVPDDDVSPPRDYAEGPEAQFRGPVHGIRLSRDGLVYVADRSSSRVQVFEKDGTYVDEVFIRPETLSMGSTWDLSLSEDPEQRWLYVPDGTNNVVWVVDRASLEVVDDFGRGGRQPGHFDWVHNLDVDSEGNVFTVEVNDGHRVQKFEPGGR